MKFTMMGLLTLMSLSAFAGNITVTCDEGDNKIVLSGDIKQNSKTILSIHNAGGLGPDFLDSSFVATEGRIDISSEDSLLMVSDFPMDGHTEVAFQAGESTEGVGHIIYPMTNKTLQLKNCNYSIK